MGNIKILFWQDFTRTFRSAVGAMFIVLFGITWFWILWQLSEGHADQLSIYLVDPQATNLISRFYDGQVVRQLFVDNSPTLSVYFLAALLTLPMFTIFAASNQTANDISSKLMRFISFRCTRSEVYIGRLLSTLAFVLLSYLIVTLIAGIVAAAVSSSVEGRNNFSIFYLIKVIVALSAYAVAFVGFMSALTAIAGSVGMANLIGGSVYLVLNMVTFFLGLQTPAGKYLGYLMPNAHRDSLIGTALEFDIVPVIVMLIYAAVFIAIGWYAFKRREI